MIAFPGLLVGPALEAGMRVPSDDESIDNGTFNPVDYPHFYVYITFQCGRPTPSSFSHWDNAKIIAEIPEDAIKQVSCADLVAMGCR